MRSVRQLSILIHHLCINDLPTKYLREKFKLTKYTRAKILDHQNTTKKKISASGSSEKNRIKNPNFVTSSTENA